MAVDFSNTEIDPTTGLAKKKQQQLPYLNESGSGSAQNILPVVQPTAASVQQGNTAVMGAAQQKALQPTNQALQQQTSDMTQKMMTDPNFGMNFNKYNTASLSNYDAQRAQAAQAARQQAGDVGGSGEVQANLMKTLLAQSGADRSALENELDMQAYTTKKQNWTDALTAGLTQQKSDSDLQTQAINNLLSTRSAYEPERAQAQAQENTLDLSKVAQQQDLEKMAVQQGYNVTNTQQAQENAIALQELGFDQQTQLVAQQQGYDLTKLKTTQDFTAAQQQIQNDLQLAMQKNDITATENLTVLKGKIDAAAQVQEQKNAIELQKLGYDQTVQTMAIQQGYDLTKLDKTFGNEMTQLITSANLDTASKSTLMELQDKIDTKQLITTQDFEAMQANLERELKVAMQNKDAATEEKLTVLKGQIDAAAQEKQNEFEDTQRIASQVYNTSERQDTENFERATQYYDWAQKNAEQNNDIEAQKDIEEMREKTQLAMQMNDMSQEEKMTYLTSQLEDAKANNDVVRQTRILNVTYAQDIAKMATEYGYDTAKIQTQANIEEALQEGEFEHAEAMQQSLLAAQAEQAQLDRGIEQVKLAQQQQGIDMTAKEQEWKTLQEGVRSGAIDSSALTEYLKGESANLGVTIESPDPLAAYEEVKNQFTAMKQEFGLSHPEYVADASTGELTAAGKIAFNAFYNKSTFGEDKKDTQSNVSKVASTVAQTVMNVGGAAGLSTSLLNAATGGSITNAVGGAANKAWKWVKGLF